MEWNRDAEWNAENAAGKADWTSPSFRFCLLFLGVFATSFFATEFFGRLVLDVKLHALVGRMSGMVYVFFIVGVSYGIVALLKMRNTWAVRCAAWPAGIAGAFLAVYMIYLSTEPSLTEVDRILFGSGWEFFYAFPVLIGLVTGEAAALRSRFLFSEKSNQWLSSYTPRKRFLFAGSPSETLDEITVEDVLNAAPVRRKRDSFSVMLFLDSLPDSEHFLRITLFDKRKNKSFSLKFSNKTPVSVTLPLNRLQVEELSDKCGPFKKTFFIALSNKHAVRRSPRVVY